MNAEVNELFLTLGIEQWKPFVTALLLPPVPFLLLALVALPLRERRRRLGSALLLFGLALTWLSGCVGMANALGPLMLKLPVALTEKRLTELTHAAGTRGAIIVLGAGVEDWAPEYQTSSLYFRSLERLRYGLWLSRRTGWPAGFTGGVGWGQRSGRPSAAEATVAQRIATQEFGQPLRWVESESKDTRENAQNTVALMSAQGIDHLLLVTNAWHMPRAMRNFQSFSSPTGITVEAAPMGMASGLEWPLLRWLPTGEGLIELRAVTREWIGMISGA